MHSDPDWKYIIRWKVIGKRNEEVVHIYVCAPSKEVADEIAYYIPGKFWLKGK